MAYDKDLANRIRELLGAERGVEEKRMFGGLAFLINGNMSVAASGRGGLIVRGWLRVSLDGVQTKRQLQGWVSRGVDYAKSLPPK